jgi:hypothetical protein
LEYKGENQNKFDPEVACTKIGARGKQARDNMKSQPQRVCSNYTPELVGRIFVKGACIDVGFIFSFLFIFFSFASKQTNKTNKARARRKTDTRKDLQRAGHLEAIIAGQAKKTALGKTSAIGHMARCGSKVERERF